MHTFINRLRRGPLTMMLVAAVLLAAPLAGATQALAAQTSDEVLSAASRARAAVIQHVLPAVVHINVTKTVEAQQQLPDIFKDPFFQHFFGPNMPKQGPQEFHQKGLGSGFIVSPDGYILTNNHVAGDADRITVKMRDGREFTAKVVGTDPASDLAVIKVDAKDLPTLSFGDSSQLEVGETVIAVGNPFGLEQTVTQGIVSAKGRSKLGLSDYEDFIQTDASINPGNSGGPLIDVTGKVVGVNTAIFSQSGGNVGIGFAIPSNLAHHIMTALMKDGKVHRGFLGVTIQDLTPELAQAMSVKPHSGVLISDVSAGSAADKAGMKQGDIVVEMNGKTVKSANELRVQVANLEPGTEVPVMVLRDGARMQLNVSLDERKPQQQVAQDNGQGGQSAPAATPEGKLGLQIQPLTQAAASQLNYEGLNGVLVSAVKQDSPAADAGLQRGALILSVNRKPVRSVKAFRTMLEHAKPDSKLLLLVRLGPATRYVALPVS